MRVLVVEDDPDLAETVAELLEDRYEVTIASDGQQALAELGAARFDAMVLDLMLPTLSGEGVLEELRRRQLGIPVLISTARDDGGEVMRETGAAAWLRKPFAVRELFAKLEQILGSGVKGGSADTPAG
jgi:DNA-binding response OmpR family regulator